MESLRSSGLNMEQPLRGSSDEGQNRNRSNHSDAARVDSEKKVRRRSKTKNPLKEEDVEKSFNDNRTIESLFEKDFVERLRNRIQIESLLENGTETRFHSVDTEKYLATDELGTIVRSDQARMAETIWEESVIRLAPLYRAALMGEWEIAEAIFNQDPVAITSEISLLNETALHVAVGTGRNLGFVEKLVNLIWKQSLSLTQEDLYGNTALGVAAIVGNLKAAEILVGKDDMLPSMRNTANYSPLHLAAKYGHRDMVLYLLRVTKDEGIFTGQSGARLLNLLISFDIFDVAVDILNWKPKLAVEQDQYGFTALQMLAEKPDVFESTGTSELSQCILHPRSRVAVEGLDHASHHHLPMQQSDVESPPEISNNADSEGALSLFEPWTSIPMRLTTSRNFVTGHFKKNILDCRKHNKKHVEACKLVKRLCEEAVKVGGKKCAKLFSTSILSAARMGCVEVAIEILRVYPYSIWFRDNRECNIFQIAVLHRQHKIYNLIYQMTSHKYFAAAFLDNNDNNILHLAGELVPSRTISGAALQLQRELQWFKEVERLVLPSYKSMRNKENKTPRMVFSDEHEELVHQGEKWMKNTASSYTVVVALIATVAFAAIFTVPGGTNSDQGIPILIHHKIFMVFVATDALALITSSTSVMMFLGILTSRYAEDDFLKALPTRLIIGLVSLFISISSMVAAFSASLCLVLVHQLKWVWAPMIVFALVPVIIFAVLQFPLLVQITSSTFGPSIFGLQSEEIIH